MKDNVKTTINIDKEVLKIIDEFARYDDRSRSQEINFILKEYIKKRDIV